MLVVSMSVTIPLSEREADQKPETPFSSVPFAKPTDKLQIETPLTFVRRVTQLNHELMRKLIWKRGSEQQ